MKFGSGIFLVGLFVWLVSCEKDEDSSGDNLSSIQGTWTLTESIFTGCNSDSLNGNTSYECTNSNCTQYSFVLDTIPINEVSQDSIVLYTYVISSKVNGSINGESGEFSVSGDRLSLCQSDEDDVEVCDDFEISFKDSSMTLLFSNNETGCRETRIFIREE